MIDNELVARRVEQFDAKHGSDCVEWTLGWLLYSDGATRETNPLGAMCGPPKDDFERLGLIVAYWEILVRRAREEFERYQFRLRGQLERAYQLAELNLPPPPPPESEIEELRRLRAVVKKQQKKLDAARLAIQPAQPKPTKQTPAARAAWQRFEQAAAAINAIEI